MIVEKALHLHMAMDLDMISHMDMIQEGIICMHMVMVPPLMGMDLVMTFKHHFHMDMDLHLHLYKEKNTHNIPLDDYPELGPTYALARHFTADWM
ncbi:hypothetical protein F0562_003639 [Nyssa sinensis]|uniref:Uncharacterized protein n=1 Tax=Nyssa sinensis TaxID=561372 RepID=A0A5J5BW02_9ASTE|nr:hypothetical protein F0562_003639 [Nyssa sinensis]